MQLQQKNWIRRICAFILAMVIMGNGSYLFTAYAAGTLKYGSKGNNVKQVQQRLTELGYYDRNVNGKFDKPTMYAVKKFQDRNKLKVTGEVTGSVWKLMKSSKAISASQTQENDVVKIGDSGTTVKKVQYRLRALGYFKGSVNGKFGNTTKRALIEFQKANSVKATGVVDNDTEKILASDGALSKNDQVKTCNVAYGDSGSAVKLVQNRLKALGYYTGKVSGKFDKNTVYAVKHFQDANNLSVTGKADTKTRKVLDSADAIRKSKATATPVPSQATPTPTKKATAAPKPTAKPTAQATATAKPAKTTSPSNGGSSAASQKIETVIAAAKKQLGKPYVLGATGMSAFDCSSFTQYAFKQAGVSIPRLAYNQGYQNLKRLTKSELKRGDLLAFNTNSRDGDRSDHVGIYLGDGTFIHASSSKGKVVISSLSSYGSFSWGLRMI